MFWIAAAVTIVFLLLLLVAEWTDSQPLRWAVKPVASTAFIVAAWAAGALESAYGVAIIVGLALSWWGDVLLIPKGQTRIFKAGVLAFLLGHVGYSAGFVVRGIDPLWSAGAAVALTGIAALILRWLWPTVVPEMKKAVIAYVVVISVMVALAVGTVAAHGDAMILVGAVMFYLSDLTVARERFVKQGFVNRITGLPAYYVAQLILAWTVMAPSGTP
jgi:uncharacterized membrane protein YhhN